jgi:hypothetical protein
MHQWAFFLKEEISKYYEYLQKILPECICGTMFMASFAKPLLCAGRFISTKLN